MPQLDPSNYFNLIFWSLITFSLIYFTVSKAFCKKVRGIIAQRKNKIEHYINGAEDFVSQREGIERKMKLLEHSFNQQVGKIRKHEDAQMVAAEARIKSDFSESSAKLKQDHKLLKINTAEDFKKKLSSQKKKIDVLVGNYLLR